MINYKDENFDFGSYLETHFEIVEHIALNRNDNKTAIGKYYDSEMSEGTGGLYILAEKWTDEFETINKGRTWDGEYFDEIEDFLKKKDAELMEEVTKFENKHIEETQKKIFSDMQNAGFNVCTCGNCGRVLFHRMNAESISCPNCWEVMDLSDCPDIY